MKTKRLPYKSSKSIKELEEAYEKGIKNMKLLMVKEALRLIKEGHEPCKDYYFSCRNCQTTLLIQLLEDEIDTIEWILLQKESDEETIKKNTKE